MIEEDTVYILYEKEQYEDRIVRAVYEEEDMADYAKETLENGEEVDGINPAINDTLESDIPLYGDSDELYSYFVLPNRFIRSDTDE